MHFQRDCLDLYSLCFGVWPGQGLGAGQGGGRSKPSLPRRVVGSCSLQEEGALGEEPNQL